MNIDWSKAPEDATHVCEEDPMHPFRKRENGCWWVWAGNHKWIFVQEPLADSYKSVSEYPGYQEKVCEWTGEGLPPVGVVCEHSGLIPGQEWTTVEIVAHRIFEGDDYPCAVFVYSQSSSHSSEGEHFRPIRPAEQIAADERLHSILNALSAINSKIEQYNINVDCSAAMRVTVEAMIDAGYRK